MELSKRLQAVADLLSEGLKIADIGCDHGFLSVYLVQAGKASGCIAMDVNHGPLRRARENIDRQGLSTYIETRLSDGAKALNPGEADAAVLAGMGGRLMVRIIEDSLEKFLAMQEFILQPQSELVLVRQFIRQIGCRITMEDMVLEEGKFYPMMRVETRPAYHTGHSDNGDKTQVKEAADVCQQELFDAFGECLLRNRHPLLKQFLVKEKKLQEEIRAALGEQSSLRSRQRIKEIEAKLKKIQQGLEWFTDEV